MGLFGEPLTQEGIAACAQLIGFLEMTKGILFVIDFLNKFCSVLVFQIGLVKLEIEVHFV